MTFKDALSWASRALASHGFDEARLEADLLLTHLLGLSRAQLYTRLTETLLPEQVAAFERLMGRRLGGEPIFYILGHREFFGLDFRVDSRVLIPTPKTEDLVKKAIEVARGASIPSPPLRLADIGTGSGAIAVCLALHLPKARVYATDISSEALEVAAANCKRHGVQDRITLLQGDLTDCLPESVDILVANLPQVRCSDLAPFRALPQVAVNGGADGLDLFRRFLSKAGGKLRLGGVILLDVNPARREEIIKLLGGHFPGARIEVTGDLTGIERVLTIRTQGE